MVFVHGLYHFLYQNQALGGLLLSFRTLPLCLIFFLRHNKQFSKISVSHTLGPDLAIFPETKMDNPSFLGIYSVYNHRLTGLLGFLGQFGSKGG
jgi:hypothetical protein